MKVLIITYYWPPAGGSGVQRWLKFVKYLQEFGIEPIVYTVDNIIYPKEDISLIEEVPSNIKVLKQPIWQPTDLFFWKKKKKTGVSNLSKGGFLSFIRGNFFIPDPKIFWVKKSVRFLQKFLNNNKIDVMHLIAEKLKKKNTVKWIADFRDTWSDLYYNKNFKQLFYARKKNKELENLVLKNADCILTVSNSLKEEFKKVATNVKVITNGFDDEVKLNTLQKLDEKFTISYIGLLPKQSNSKVFFNVLNKLCKENNQFKKDLKLHFIGDISDEVQIEIKKNNLQLNSTFFGYVSHKKAIEFQQKSQVLLLLIPNVHKAEGILTGKLFEYLAAKRPILAIGPKDGDLSKILQETKAGTVVDFNNEQQLTKEIKRLYKNYTLGNTSLKSIDIEKYHRKKLTSELAKIIKSLTN